MLSFFTGGHIGVSMTLTRPWQELWLRGRGVRHPELLIVAANVLNADLCLDNECLNQHWNPILNEC